MTHRDGFAAEPLPALGPKVEKPKRERAPVQVAPGVVRGADGRSLGLFRAGNDWQGMRALTSLVPAPDSRVPALERSHTTIVIEAPHSLVELFAGTLNEGVTVDVVKCSPSLMLDILGNLQAKEDTHHGG